MYVHLHRVEVDRNSEVLIGRVPAKNDTLPQFYSYMILVSTVRGDFARCREVMMFWGDGQTRAAVDRDLKCCK